MGASSKTQKKNIGQVKIFCDSCKIWDAKVHYNLLPESNLPATEYVLFESPVRSHGCWKNNKENSKRSDRKNSCYKK